MYPNIAHAGTGTATATTGVSRKRPMTEEEEMERAIQASLKESKIEHSTVPTGAAGRHEEDEDLELAKAISLSMGQ
eukprot:TRINITY_DN1296_c0_g1_i1.p5 TRINITY_DN1296_c0_g1~~TRINITY_DN1296_c0_g1_i1.p5  ORF type:complete len:76 (-),score=14.93 TRINITY_DN1296_c0_g1_i1:29-256(-)